MTASPFGPAGNPRAREVEAVRPLVRAVVARMMNVAPSHPDAEDCTAETLRRIVEGAARVKDGEPLAPWATGVARHVAIDWMRERKRSRARSVEIDEPAAVELRDPRPSPEQHAASREAMDAVRAALATLAEGPREAVVAFHIEGLSYEEIARRLGVPMGTVATWIARSRQHLAEALEKARRQKR